MNYILVLIVVLLVALFAFFKFRSSTPKSGVKDPKKQQFEVSVDHIILNQKSDAPPDFAAKEGAAGQGIGEAVTALSQQITKIPHPIPTYCYPIPKIIPVLSIRALQYVGVYAEGIFRRGIDMDLLESYIRDCDAGLVTKLSTTDPQAYAVLLKTWLRRLADPLVPEASYAAALKFARDNEDDDDDENFKKTGTYNNYDTFSYYNNNDGTNVTAITTFLNTHLNTAHNLSLKYLTRFLRIFTLPAYVKHNFMGIDNIVTVMASNIIHAKSNLVNPTDAIANLPRQMGFTTQLIRDLCITATEEALFEYIDQSVRTELNVPEENSCSILRYYTWE